jgi:hypothetical protein
MGYTMQNISMIGNGDLECAEVGVAYFKALLQRLPVGTEANNETNSVMVRSLLVEIQT